MLQSGVSGSRRCPKSAHRIRRLGYPRKSTLFVRPVRRVLDMGLCCRTREFGIAHRVCASAHAFGWTCNVIGVCHPADIPSVERLLGGYKMRKSSSLKRAKKRAARGREIGREDSVASERSDYSHWELEKAVVDLCLASGMQPLANKHMDLLVHSGSTSVIFEVKACSATNVGERVRQAIYQLLEYRFLYRERLRCDVRLCVVAQRRPGPGVDLLLKYMESLSIGVVWKDEASGRLACSEFTRKLLIDALPWVAELA